MNREQIIAKIPEISDFSREVREKRAAGNLMFALAEGGRCGHGRAFAALADLRVLYPQAFHAGFDAEPIGSLVSCAICLADSPKLFSERNIATILSFVGYARPPASKLDCWIWEPLPNVHCAFCPALQISLRSHGADSKSRAQSSMQTTLGSWAGERVEIQWVEGQPK